MESVWEQNPPLYPKSHPLTAEAAVGYAVHGSVFVFLHCDAYNDHYMQIGVRSDLY